MKTLIKLLLVTTLLSLALFGKSIANEKVKIGLIVPLSGEYKEIGISVVQAMRMAINKIGDDKIVIKVKDNFANPRNTLEAAEQLYSEGVKIIVGPVFNKNLALLSEFKDVTFVSFTNKINGNPNNVISAGVNAVSQINTIKKFQKRENLERSVFLIPKTEFQSEIDYAIKKTKINLKDKFIYDTDPTKLTAQIEKITRYPQRKQNLIDEINRVENSEDVNKEKKIEALKKKDTLGGINFDSVIIADFEENLKSVATSLLYTDVSSKRVKYITLNQWFDPSLVKEKNLQPIYFPSVNEKNFQKFNNEYLSKFDKNSNQIAFLSYDIVGLIYYLLYKNDFIIDKNLFYKENIFKGKIGVFEINKNIITHKLNFYVVEDEKIKKIF